MYIIAGLGNPTKEYENTRHNAGFMAIDAIAKKFDIDVRNVNFKALTGTGYIEGEKVLLMKPLTYMNLSGESIVAALNYYKVDVEDEFIVLYDDISLDVGKLRLRAKGSAGGHNGIKSIISHVGTDKFKRVKIGVGNKPAHFDLADYVLGHFSSDELATMKDATSNVADAVKEALVNDFSSAMNKFN